MWRKRRTFNAWDSSARPVTANRFRLARAGALAFSSELLSALTDAWGPKGDGRISRLERTDTQVSAGTVPGSNASL